MPARVLVATSSLAVCLAACSQATTPAPLSAPPAPSPTSAVATAPVVRRPREAIGERRIEAAWTDSERAFYEAGRIGEAGYPPLVKSFAPGAPALASTVAWVAALSSAGVVAPARYRVGDAHVVWVRGRVAEVTGCTYDTGSVYRTSGDPAPPDLGGGPGLTASVAVLHEVRQKWLVWSDQTSTPSSAEEDGPCHGF